MFEKLQYEPHPGQLAAHQAQAKLIAVAGGWRSGKSEFVRKEIIARLPWCAVPRGGAGKVALAAQEYDETHAEMAGIIADLEALDGLVSQSVPKTGKWQAVTADGVSIETISLQDGPEELSATGDPFDIVALLEWGLVREDVLTAALGRTSETDGLVLAAGTLRDTVGWQADLYRALEAWPNVYAGRRFSFPAWENVAIYPGGRDDPRIRHLENTLPAEEFLRVVAAEIRPSPARMYPEFSFSDHVAELEFDEDRPVELAVDAGYYPSHYAVLALQVAEEAVRLDDGSVVRMECINQIDEVWEQHRTHQDIYDIVSHKPWWKKVERVVGGHESRQHQAAESTQEVWQNLARGDGKRLRFDVFDAGRVLDGVVRVKTMLRDPGTNVARYRCGTGCLGTQHEFQHYSRKTDARGEVTSDEPEDKDNDALDALRNWMVSRYGLIEQVRRHREARRRDRSIG